MLGEGERLFLALVCARAASSKPWAKQALLRRYCHSVVLFLPSSCLPGTGQRESKWVQK